MAIKIIFGHPSPPQVYSQSIAPPCPFLAQGVIREPRHIRPRQPPPRLAATTLCQPSIHHPRTPVTQTINNNKILLVEDDPQDVKMTLAALNESHLGSVVTVARDGAEALDYLYYRAKFKTRPVGDPIVVLLDNKMPKVTGLEVLKTIKADEHLKTIPVVALTSSRLTSDLNDFYKYGVNAYVVKPVGFSEFVTAIKQLGVFWMAVNEPPPGARRNETGVQNGNLTFPEKKEGKNEIHASYTALER